MKPVLKIFLPAAFLLCLSAPAWSQCKMDECVSKLNGGYTFLKGYQMNNGSPKAEYSYVFSKETNYMLAMCGKDGGSQNIAVTLYDSSNKQIATNFDKKSGKYYPAIIYNCKSTGIYYIKFISEVTPECFTGVLAFKK
jgi:hypothetical protein